MIQLQLLLAAIAFPAPTHSEARLVGVIGTIDGRLAYWKPDGTLMTDVPKGVAEIAEDRSGVRTRTFVFEVDEDSTPKLPNPQSWRVWVSNNGDFESYTSPGAFGEGVKGPLRVHTQRRLVDKIKEVDLKLSGPTNQFDVVWTQEIGKEPELKMEGLQVFTMVPEDLNGKKLRPEDLKGLPDTFELCARYSKPQEARPDSFSAVATDVDGKEHTNRTVRGTSMGPTTPDVTLQFDFDIGLKKIKKVELRRNVRQVFTFEHVRLDPKDTRH